MATLKWIMAELASKGSDKTCSIYERHGNHAKQMFGVSVANLKEIAKTIKGQQALALELYATGNFDAMYLAGMVADGVQMDKRQLQAWAEGASGMPMISEYTVPWVTVENPRARDVALDWMRSDNEYVAASGWSTYSGIVGIKADAELDIAEIERLLGTVVKDIHTAPNRVRYVMNGFVIAVGTCVKPLLKQAKAAAQKIGEVSVDVGDTDCKVPLASAYIAKNEAAGRVGKKRKTIRC